MLPTPITTSASRRRFSKNAWWIDVERAHLLCGVDHARDVALGRTLSDRADVDVVTPERAEHAGRHTPGRPLHPVADDGDDRLVGVRDRDASVAAELEPELVARSRQSPWRRRLAAPRSRSVCSEEACEIRITFTRSRMRACGTTARPMPGTPTMLSARASVSSEIVIDGLMPLATADRSAAALAVEMSVPGATWIQRVLDENRNPLRDRPARSSPEWSTLAPK